MAYKHLRKMSAEIANIEHIDPPPYTNAFRGPPFHIDRVSTSLQVYLRKMEEMKTAEASLLTAILNTCPKTWPVLTELKIYIEDQPTLWGQAVSALRPMFTSLRNYAGEVSAAQQSLHEFEECLDEVKSVNEEYEQSNESPSTPLAERNQTEKRLRETEAKLVDNRKVAVEKLLNFRKTQRELGKRLMQKFEEVVKQTNEDNLQIIDLIEGRLGAVPASKLSPSGLPAEDVAFADTVLQKVIAKVDVHPADLTKKLALDRSPVTVSIKQSSSLRRRCLRSAGRKRGSGQGVNQPDERSPSPPSVPSPGPRSLSPGSSIDGRVILRGQSANIYYRTGRHDASNNPNHRCRACSGCCKGPGSTACCGQKRRTPSRPTSRPTSSSVTPSDERSLNSFHMSTAKTYSIGCAKKEGDWVKLVYDDKAVTICGQQENTQRSKPPSKRLLPNTGPRTYLDELDTSD